MNSETVRESRSIAKDKDLHGSYKLMKADLVALLLEQSSEEMPAPPPRASAKERRRALLVNIVSGSEEMDEFEKMEIKKSRPVVKNRLNEWYDWLVDYVPKPIKNAISKAFSRAKNSILGLYDGAKNTLKGDVEAEAEKKNQEEEDVELKHGSIMLPILFLTKAIIIGSYPWWQEGSSPTSWMLFAKFVYIYTLLNCKGF